MWDRKLEELKATMLKEIPGFEVRFKTESRIQKIIGKLLFFNKRYMSDFTSTFYPHVYFPTEEFYEEDAWRSFVILAHEYIHLWDRKNKGWMFNIGYLFPQILALLGLISVGGIFYAPLFWFALFFLFLAPLPAPLRAQYEFRGYAVNIMCFHDRVQELPDDVRSVIENAFLTGAYYYMYPFKKAVKNEIASILEGVKDESFFKQKGNEPHLQIKRILENEL